MSCATLQNSYVNASGGSAPPPEGGTDYLTWSSGNSAYGNSSFIKGVNIEGNPGATYFVLVAGNDPSTFVYPNTPNALFANVQLKTTNGSGGNITVNLYVETPPNDPTTPGTKIASFILTQTTVTTLSPTTTYPCAGIYNIPLVGVIPSGFTGNTLYQIGISCSSQADANTLSVEGISVVGFTQSGYTPPAPVPP